MSKELTMMEARQCLTQLPELLADAASGGAATITRRGKPVLAVMSWEFYDSLLETLEVMSDPDLMAQLRQSIQEIKKGEGSSLDEVEAKLG